MDQLIESLFPDLLVEYDCSPNTKSTGFHLIHRLVLNTKQYPELNNYISDMIDNNHELLDIPNSAGWTPLILASRNSNTLSSEITVELLIKKQANINAQTFNGWSSVMIASQYSNSESSHNTVRMLINYNADLNLIAKNGWTALMSASGKSNTTSSDDTIKLLIDNRADPNIINVDKWCALTIASRHSNTKSSENTVKLILDAKADPNIVNVYGWSALMMASWCSNTDSSEATVKILIEAQANLNIVNKKGNWTALKLAIHHVKNGSSMNTVQMLVNAGAYLDNSLLNIPDGVKYDDLDKILICANMTPNNWSTNINEDMTKFIIMNHSSPPYHFIDYNLSLDMKITCFIKNLGILPIILKNTKDGQMIYDLCLKINLAFKNHKLFSHVMDEIPNVHGQILYGPESKNAKLAKEHFKNLI
jgi:ankyrin repeat protein